MNLQTKETIYIAEEQALIILRNTIRKHAAEIGFSVLEQTKLITAASELGRNILFYAKSGSVLMEHLDQNNRQGLKLTFEDKGPGIADIKRAMQPGVTTGSGFGLGLPGAKKLVNEFEIKSEPGQGTTIIITLWKHGR